MGIPSIAISQLGRDKFDYDTAVRFAQKLVGVVRRNPLPPGIVLNVNVPANCQNLDFEICKTGKRNYGEIYEERIDPRGRPYYWIGGNLYEFQNIPESDCNAIQSGKISITPLKVNITDHNFIDSMKAWKW
jgi:5'-nucleotidase